MSFALVEEESWGDGCHRILLEQTDAAMDLLSGLEKEPDRAIHEFRKCNKRIRGALHLIKPCFKKALLSQADSTVRDAARLFSHARDAAVMQETLERLRERFGAELDGNAAATLRGEFERRHREELEHASFGPRVDEAALAFRQVKTLVGRWPWSELESRHVLSGWEANYRRGVREFEIARETRSGEDCHSWRKRAKYLAYHYEILTFLDPERVGRLAIRTARLASWLGEHHDLDVLEKTAPAASTDCREAWEKGGLARLVATRKRELEDASFALGEELYGDDPEQQREKLTAMLTTVVV